MEPVAVAATISLAGSAAALCWGARRRRRRHLSGTKLKTYRQALKAARRTLAKGERPLWWGGVPVAQSEASTHFYVCGMSGSGKTVTLRLLMQQVLPLVGRGKGHRALLYDAKGDLLPVLSGMRGRGLDCDIYTLNPFDGRDDPERRLFAAGWDIASDCRDEIAALEVATILCPVPREGRNFFEQAARNILFGVILGLMEASGARWRFEDLFIALRDQRHIEALMQKTPKGKSLHEYAFGRRERVDDVLNTLVGVMTAYEPIAALWSHASRRLSLSQWVEGESLLVLSHSEQAETPVDAVNRVLFTRLSQLLLDRPEGQEGRTWMYLDEAAKIRSLAKLELLLTNGRSKGVCCVLGFQDIEGLQEAFGVKGAHSLLNQCGCAALLKAQGNTARFEAQVLGEYEALARRQGQSVAVTLQRGGSTVSFQEQLERREAVFHAEFQNLPATNRQNGLSGYYKTPATGAFGPVTMDGRALFERELWPKDASTPALCRRPREQQKLLEWRPEVRHRLGVEERPCRLRPAAGGERKLRVFSGGRT